MEQIRQLVDAASPPKKKRGRPKKAERMLQVVQGEGSHEALALTKEVVVKVRRKKRKSFSKSMAVPGRKKRHQRSSDKSIMVRDAGAVTRSSPEKDANIACSVTAGQPVHGVIDGTFDAGYLVTVRVGDSDTVFRGVVFCPGLSLPLSKDNDVAPKMKKINRDDAAEAITSNSDPLVMTEAPAPALSTSICVSSPPHTAAYEAHRVGSMGGSFGVPPSSVPVNAVSYSSVDYRTPTPILHTSTSGGFYYPPPPTQQQSLSSINNHHGYYPPRGVPYPFHFSSAPENTGSPQLFTGAGVGPPPSASASPGLQGALPPRAS